MDKQNVTLSVPKDILRKAKIIAIERNTSLSGLLTRLLIDVVTDEDRYDRAKRYHLALLADPPDLGTGGSISWTRDELHER